MEENYYFSPIKEDALEDKGTPTNELRKSIKENLRLKFEKE